MNGSYVNGSYVNGSYVNGSYVNGSHPEKLSGLAASEGFFLAPKPSADRRAFGKVRKSGRISIDKLRKM